MPLAAVGKGRPRLGRHGVYTPEKTKAFEDAVALYGRRAFKEPISGPVEVEISAYYEPPKSWSKRRKDNSLGFFKPTKPDGDNIQKSICDALNSIAWHDDSQIVRWLGEKKYGFKNSILVRVRTVGDD